MARKTEAAKERARAYSRDLRKERSDSGLCVQCGSASYSESTRCYDHYRMTIVSSAKHRAIKQGVPFGINYMDVEIPEVCPVLGLNLIAGGTNKDNSPSLDKLIPSRGYVPGNVFVISNRANSIKRDATLEELRLVADYVESKADQ